MTCFNLDSLIAISKVYLVVIIRLIFKCLSFNLLVNVNLVLCCTDWACPARIFRVDAFVVPLLPLVSPAGGTAETGPSLQTAAEGLFTDRNAHVSHAYCCTRRCNQSWVVGTVALGFWKLSLFMLSALAVLTVLFLSLTVSLTVLSVREAKEKLSTLGLYFKFSTHLLSLSHLEFCFACPINGHPSISMLAFWELWLWLWFIDISHIMNTFDPSRAAWPMEEALSTNSQSLLKLQKPNSAAASCKLMWFACTTVRLQGPSDQGPLWFIWHWCQSRWFCRLSKM